MAWLIVLIDDSPEDLYAIERLLSKKSEEYILKGFSEVSAAINYIYSNPVDCIVVDYNLPGYNTLELVSAYQLNVESPAPVIILTGQGNEELAASALKMGVSDYLVKTSLSLDALTKSILYVIEKRKNQVNENAYKEFLKVLLNTVPDPLYYLDKEGHYLGCNKAYEEFIGIAIGDIVGKTIFDIYPEELARFFHNKDQELHQNPGTQIYECVVRKGEEERYVLNKKATFNDSKGQVAGIIGTIDDITEMKMQEINLTVKSYFDSLTQIHNRRWFDEKIASIWYNCMRANAPMSLIMIDIDHFKLYNDSHGHQEGDRCLTLVAQTLKNSLGRSSDYIVRYGGEEFMVVLGYTNGVGAMHIAEKMLKDIRGLALPHKGLEGDATVAISLGIITCNRADVPLTDYIKHVDDALYKAKSTGRNKAIAYEDIQN